MINKCMRKKGVVYLNRKAEGHEPVQRFIRSYKSFVSGDDHEFITVYKGFSKQEKAIEEQTFKGIEHRQVIVDDEMTDIDAYLIAAESFADIDYFCFLNTFSEIVCENWLLYLFSALRSESVGIAGASASYESLLNSNKLISKILLFAGGALRYDKKIHQQYRTLLEKHYPKWSRYSFVSQILDIFRKRAKSNYEYLGGYDSFFNEFWQAQTNTSGVYNFLDGYPPFPNPHIRSNGFAIRRHHLLPFFKRGRSMSKQESYLFESGPHSLTRSLINAQLRAVLVNSSGRIFDVADWPLSQSFRLNIDQRGLLIHDNQSRAFANLTAPEKDVNELISWGDSARKISDRVFTFGISFDAGMIT